MIAVTERSQVRTLIARLRAEYSTARHEGREKDAAKIKFIGESVARLIELSKETDDA